MFNDRCKMCIQIFVAGLLKFDFADHLKLRREKTLNVDSPSAQKSNIQDCQGILCHMWFFTFVIFMVFVFYYNVLHAMI